MNVKLMLDAVNVLLLTTAILIVALGSEALYLHFALPVPELVALLPEESIYAIPPSPPQSV